MQDVTNSPLRQIHIADPVLLKKTTLTTHNVENSQNESPKHMNKGERQKFRQKLWARVKELFFTSKKTNDEEEEEEFGYE